MRCPVEGIAIQALVKKCPGWFSVVVPEALATLAGLADGEPAELEAAGGRLIIRGVAPDTLAALLAGVTADNRHGEWAVGPPVRREVL